jgi:hypothetical protein
MALQAMNTGSNPVGVAKLLNLLVFSESKARVCDPLGSPLFDRDSARFAER